MSDTTVTTPADSPESIVYELRQHLPIPHHPLLYWLVLGIVFGLYTILGYLLTSMSYGSGWNELNLGYMVWAVGVVHFLLSLRVVRREQIAGIEVLGWPTIIVGGGPVIELAGLFELMMETARVHELKWPQDPSKLYYGHEDIVPAGYEMPIRIPFADSTPGGGSSDTNDPTERRSTNTVSLFVRIAIRQEEFWDFHTRIGSIEREARSQVRGMAISFINQELTKLTLSEALKNIDRISKELCNHIRQETKGWGVEIVTARLQLIELSYSLNKKLEEAAESAADCRATITMAQGTKVKLTLEGEGAANAVAAELAARGKGLKEQADHLGLDAQTALGAEIARDLANGQATKIVVPGVENMLNFAAGIASALKGKPTEPEKKT